MSEEKILWFEGESAEMRAAAERARATFKYLWRELSWEYRRIIPGLDLAAIKMAFRTGRTDDAPEVEHMWVGELQFDGHTIYGVLLNNPQWFSSIRAGDPVSVPLTEIGDWMYAIQGKVYGAHSVDVMRSAMSSSERAEHDQAWGLDFGKPGKINLIPTPNMKKPGMLSGLFQRKGEADKTDLDAEVEEHPMSENMLDKMDQGLKENPSLTHSVDEAGWTLLQREALAGNLGPVSLLVRHGADPAALNPKGESARDLARKMGWPRIVAFLDQA